MLLDALRQRRHGLRFYGLTPPKRGQDTVKVREIAARQMARIAALAPDALVLYDLQDEAGRNGVDRPFPFLPTLDPQDYARDFLAGLPLPKVLYACVGNRSRADFLAWADALAASPTGDACVLVGAPSSKAASRPAAPGTASQGGTHAASGALSLHEAYALLRGRPTPIAVGGVAIAERHARKLDEDERLLSKVSSGCSFFISQTIFDASATKSLLSDYALRFSKENAPPAPFILSFSPCGGLKTMEFMKWLGISFPRWLENELRHSPDILGKSVDLAARVFEEIRDFAEEKKIPIGINVESVSIRKEEIDASCALFSRLSDALKAGSGSPG